MELIDREHTNTFTNLDVINTEEDIQKLKLEM